MVFPLVGLSTIFIGLQIIDGDQLLQIMLAALGSVAVAAGLFYGLFMISSGKWIGGGDVKLGIALGLLLTTPLNSMLMLFIASCLGSLWAMPALLQKRNLKLKLPFGPFLIVATIVVFFFGESFINWYETNFLFALYN